MQAFSLSLTSAKLQKLSELCKKFKEIFSANNNPLTVSWFTPYQSPLCCRRLYAHRCRKSR